MPIAGLKNFGLPHLAASCEPDSSTTGQRRLSTVEYLLRDSMTRAGQVQQLGLMTTTPPEEKETQKPKLDPASPPPCPQELENGGVRELVEAPKECPPRLLVSRPISTTPPRAGAKAEDPIMPSAVEEAPPFALHWKKAEHEKTQDDGVLRNGVGETPVTSSVAVVSFSPQKKDHHGEEDKQGEDAVRYLCWTDGKGSMDGCPPGWAPAPGASMLEPESTQPRLLATYLPNGVILRNDYIDHLHRCLGDISSRQQSEEQAPTKAKKTGRRSSGTKELGAVVKNTFIECPAALRSASFDEEICKGWKSCPVSRMQSEVESHAAEIRAALLAEEAAETSTVSTGISSDMSDKAEEDAEASEGQEPAAEPTTAEEAAANGGLLPGGMIVKNTFLDFPVPLGRGTSLDDYMDEKGWKSCPVSRMNSESFGSDESRQHKISEIQASVIEELFEPLDGGSETDTEEVSAFWRAPEEFFFQQEQHQQQQPQQPEQQPQEQPQQQQQQQEEGQPVVVYPPVFSVGSVPHQLGQRCQPCGFVHKATGCSNMERCEYCHLCPPGTLKMRKKAKKEMIRETWRAQRYSARAGVRHNGGWLQPLPPQPPAFGQPPYAAGLW